MKRNYRQSARSPGDSQAPAPESPAPLAGLPPADTRADGGPSDATPEAQVLESGRPAGAGEAAGPGEALVPCRSCGEHREAERSTPELFAPRSARRDRGTYPIRRPGGGR